MFFLPRDQRSCATLKHILALYEEASGQRINTNKSSISFAAKTPASIKNDAKQTLGILKEGGVGKYMGLPEHFGRRKRDLFSSIVDKIKIKTASWSTKCISSAGKMTMLKAVLSPHTVLCYDLLPAPCWFVKNDPISPYTLLVGHKHREKEDVLVILG